MSGTAPAPGLSPRRRLALLVGLAVAIRIAYGLEYASLPFFWGPVFDSLVYEQQAMAILAGRFDDPTLLAYSPLYGWFLAAFGPSSGLLPFVVQLAMGTATLLLLRRVAMRLSGGDADVGDVAFALGLGYGMLRFYETKLMSETLGLFLLAAALDAWTSEPFRRGRVRVAVLAGVLLGLAVLARASLLFAAVLAPVLLLLPVERGEPGRPRLARALGLALGLLAVFGANGLSNRRHVGLFVPVILVSRTVERANATDATGSFRDFAGDDGVVTVWDVVDQARERIARERRGEPAPASVGSIDPRGFLAHLPGKLAATFRDVETTHDYGYYGERTELASWLLAPVSFGALALLAALGLARTIRIDPRRLLALAPIVLGTLATTTLFHPTSRYRLPLALALVLLAAPEVVALVRDARAGRRRGLAYGVALACSVFAVRLATHPLASPATWEMRVAESAFVAGDVRTYAERVARARRLAPNDPEIERTIEALERSGRR